MLKTFIVGSMLFLCLSFEANAGLENKLTHFVTGVSKKELISYKQFKNPLHKATSCTVRHLMTPVKSQGARGNCTLFATTAVLERYIKETLSEECTILYFRGTLLERYKRYIIPFALKFFIKHGIVSEEKCPYPYYTKSDNFSPLSKSGYKNLVQASNINLTWLKPEIFDTKHGVESLNFIRQKIEKGNPVAIGLTVADFWQSNQGEIIQYPSGQVTCNGKLKNSLKDCASNGHAITITGFDDKHQILEFKNSWGKDWGYAGYGTMTYDYYLHTVNGFIFTQSGFWKGASCL